VNRRAFLSLLGLSALALPAAASPAAAFLIDEDRDESMLRRRRELQEKPSKKTKSQKPKKQVRKAAKQKIAYKGREVVDLVMPDGKAKRYLVAVGKEGFAWSGVARIGMKRKNPTWTPPAEMIKRTPKYAKWKNGMPGGIPENPLGSRALYLFDRGGDTMYRIHGTNAPSSIGTAASSGCIRMLNKEVTELFDNTPVGTKVIVQ